MSFREFETPVEYPKLENEILNFWEQEKIFQKSIDTRPEDRPFNFYEGPPTANGRPGIHHVISRAIKDFVCRYKTMQGYRVHRKAGWDTHGLPVEIEVEKQLGFESKDQIEAYGVAKFNQKCRESVFTYLKEWNEMTRRIGFWLNLEDPYITYTNSYIESVWWLLSELWKKDFLYLGFKILPYCPRCETALSSHETSLGYDEVKDRSITAKFALEGRADRYILAWTTTPWTLPGNVALAVGKEILYAEVEQQVNGKTEIYYLAESRLGMLQGEYKVLRTFPGKEMNGWHYRPLFDFVNLADEKHTAYYVALADFVTTEEGTGVVHTAVMYGEDDYQLGMKLGLPARHTVDEQGRFNELVELWKGMYVKDPEVEKGIIRYLKENNRFYSSEMFTHSYPHCWRCDSPLLYYAKKSWYLRTTRVRDQLIRNNASIQWYPREVGEGRFGQWLENNVDWALSRDRYWGTPLNVWICQDCGKQLAVGSIEELKRLSGLSKLEDLHKPTMDEITIPCQHCKGTMRRTPEVIDCWFDSGSMPYAQAHYPFENQDLEKQFPADFISEGVDQTRGWFYSMLAISTMISGVSSYKSCLSIELILDKNGQKMSKSRGNAVDPFKILDRYGADPLRWYLFTISPPWVPTRFDEEGVDEVIRKFFGTLLNTYSFFALYANIDDFVYPAKPIPVKDRPEIDRWILSELHLLVKRVSQLLERYDVTKAARAIQDFTVDDLSNWYVRRNRRRFWKSEQGDEKSAAFQTLFEAIFTISKLIAPFTPFLSEALYRNLNESKAEPWQSVHLSSYPDVSDPKLTYLDKALVERMNLARRVVILCRAARNEAGIKVRQPLRKVLVSVAGDRQKESISALEKMILEEVNVKGLEFVEDASSLIVKKAKPIFRNLGPKFGSHVNQAAEIIRGFNREEIGMLERGETIHVSLDTGKHGDVSLSDIELEIESPQDMTAECEGDLVVALDTRMDEELLAEGMAREFVNRIQNLRKSSGFQVTDRIRIVYKADADLAKAIELKKEYISQETLAVSLESGDVAGDARSRFDIDHVQAEVGIIRVSA